uniref:Uncharacterized protein n=1 Tax=Vespula pensylvanica TaxID=30213 RepID=A0A834KWN3_VESPE|nr:hypothetical protein H0235_013158 [Vespula pensylvanica]
MKSEPRDGSAKEGNKNGRKSEVAWSVSLEEPFDLVAVINKDDGDGDGDGDNDGDDDDDDDDEKELPTPRIFFCSWTSRFASQMSQVRPLIPSSSKYVEKYIVEKGKDHSVHDDDDDDDDDDDLSYATN